MTTSSDWQPIETARFDDQLYEAWKVLPGSTIGGRIDILDFDHDCDAQWMYERGWTHWRPHNPPTN